VGAEDEFRTERVLLNQVVELGLEQPGAPRSLTDVRVRELFGSILHTDAVEHEDEESTWVETILTSAADFVAVTRGHQFETSCRGAQQSTPFCSLWHPVAAAGMGASVSERHEHTAAPDTDPASPTRRQTHDYGVLPYASW
jgi:hypothetical protein